MGFVSNTSSSCMSITTPCATRTRLAVCITALVGAILCAAGAFAAYFTQLGIPATVAFGGLSGVLIGMALLTCVCRQKNPTSFLQHSLSAVSTTSTSFHACTVSPVTFPKIAPLDYQQLLLQGDGLDSTYQKQIESIKEEEKPILNTLFDNFNQCMERLNKLSVGESIKNDYFQFEKIAPHVVGFTFQNSVQSCRTQDMQYSEYTSINVHNGGSQIISAGLSALVELFRGFVYEKHSFVLGTGTIRGKGFMLFLNGLEEDPWDNTHIVSAGGACTTIDIQLPAKQHARLTSSGLQRQ